MAYQKNIGVKSEMLKVEATLLKVLSLIYVLNSIISQLC